MKWSGSCAPHQNQPAVHLVERPPEHHHAGGLQLLQARRELVELFHPPPVGVSVGLEQVRDLHARVAQTAAPRVGGIVEVGAHRDQSALPPVGDGRLVRGLEGESAATEVRVIDPHEGRPMTGQMVNLLQHPEIGAAAKIGELAGQDAPRRLPGQRVEVVEHGAGLGIGLGVGGFGGDRRAHARAGEDEGGEPGAWHGGWTLAAAGHSGAREAA